MPRLRALNFSVSLDGYAAGPHQTLETPLGVGGERLHEWALATPAFHESHAMPGGPPADAVRGLDDAFIRAGVAGIGATIMGRNMFGPVRGPWPDESWRGWWGEEPPFHHPVFVLTHHARPALTLGETTFHFVTDGIEAALEHARAAAGERDIRLGGGTSTIQQYLRAGLLDELHLAIAPVLLGSGERLLDGSPDALGDLRCVEIATQGTVAHMRFAR